eukprot:jgi/Mesvir1/16762/Mv15134-RA.1
MSTKLIPIEVEEADDGAGGGVSAPVEAAAAPQPPPPPQTVPRGDADGGGGGTGYVMRGPMLYRPDVAPPVNMDRFVQEAMPPSPPREHVVQIIDDGGESLYDDASVQGDEIRTVQVDAGKKKPRKRGGGGKKAAGDPTKVVFDL